MSGAIADRVRRRRILVTPRSMTSAGFDGLGRLERAGFDVVCGPAGRQPDIDQLHSLLPGCAGWIAGVEPITRELLERGRPTLAVIARNGAGTDNVDTAAAAELGILVRNAAGANASGVAELTLSLMLAGLRRLVIHATDVAGGGWHREIGRELSSAVVGVVGVGAIGGRVAALAHSFGAEVVACDPYATPRPDAPYTLVELPALIERANVISLHVPGGDCPLFGAAEFDHLRQRRAAAVLVNTARWSLVDDGSALAALTDGTLAAYAVDAFATEPPELTALIRHPRVIATPHLGAFTRESAGRAANMAIDRVIEALGAEEQS